VVALVLLALIGGDAVKEDQTQITDLHHDFIATWSRGDAKALVAFFATNATRVGVAGDVQHGQAEIRAAFERLFAGPFKGATIVSEPGTVRMLGNGFALWQGAIEIRPAGAPPPMRGYALDVMEKVNDRWLILETHPKAFPPPPAK